LLRATARQASKKMRSFIYVHVLQSESNPRHFYTGRTNDLRERLVRHNSGKVAHENASDLGLQNHQLQKIALSFACSRDNFLRTPDGACGGA
jgi:predicted GIY-YIG superfamily endonuclease